VEIKETKKQRNKEVDALWTRICVGTTKEEIQKDDRNQKKGVVMWADKRNVTK